MHRHDAHGAAARALLARKRCGRNLGGGKPEVKLRGGTGSAEAEVYEGLCANRWGTQIRLEQERIGFGHVCRALQELA